MNYNPFHYGASHILQRLDPASRVAWHPRSEIEDAAQSIVAALGLPCSVRGLENGTMALVIVCGLLREHGAAIKAISDAHNTLHQPTGDELPPKRAW
jgi:hypothetical protein